MKKLFFSLLLTSSFLSANKQSQTMISQQLAVGYLAKMKNVFETVALFLGNRPPMIVNFNDSTFTIESENIIAFLSTLKDPLKIKIIDTTDSSKFCPQLNPKIYLDMYNQSHNWKYEQLADLELYQNYFELTIKRIQNLIANEEVKPEDQQDTFLVNAAICITTLLTEDLTVIKEKVNVVKAMEETLVQ